MEMENVNPRGLFNPKDKHEQIDAVIEFVLDNNVYYVSLGCRPERLDAAIRKAFVEKDVRGYRASVLRAAKVEMNANGTIANGDPYTEAELEDFM